MSITRDKKIFEYYNSGYTQKEICCLLLNDGFKLSMRHLRRLLCKLELSRRKCNLTFSELYDLVKKETENSGSLLGYRSLHQKIRVIHKVQISRMNVSKLQASIDPAGVALRKSGKLTRRRYISLGPNYLWHLDGYDKLKRYGFCIHGCIDGFSRKVLWLQVASTNNCPKVVASYFIKEAKAIGGSALTIRSDKGTENLNIAALQTFFRTNVQSNRPAFMFGRSTANQRIEAFWSRLRKSWAHWWMNYFKDMIDDGSFDETDNIQRECLKFCYTEFIQKELDEYRIIHNTHRIRPYRHHVLPSGKPNIMYSRPSIYGAADFKVGVHGSLIDLSSSYTRTKAEFGCSNDFKELALRLMVQHNLFFPKDATECKALYNVLLTHISNI